MKTKRRPAKAVRSSTPWNRMLTGLLRWEWLLVFVALLCDWNSWGHKFVMDDLVQIVDNTSIQSPATWFNIFTHAYNQNLGSQGDLYRPLTRLSFAVNTWISGSNPDSFHVVNRAIHVLVCLGIFWLLRRLFPKPPHLAVFTSLLFAAHPVQTEAITYINGRADSMGMLLFVFAWLFWVRARISECKDRISYILSLLLFFLALLSKESAITWLGVVLLTELIIFSKGRLGPFFLALRSNLLRIYAGYFITAIGYVLIRFLVLHRLADVNVPMIDNPLATAPAIPRLLTALKIMFQSIGQLLWPAYFSSDYYYNQIPLITRWNSPTGFGVIGLGLIFAGLLMWTYRRSPNAFFGFSFFLITYSIVSNVFVVIGTNRADRLLYMPSLGILLVAGSALAHVEERLTKPLAKRFFYFLVGVLLLVLAVRTILRNKDWQDTFTLSLKTVETSPRSTTARRGLGLAYYNRKQFSQALEQLQVAESIYSDYPELLNDIGSTLMQQGKPQEAVVYFRRAVKLAPLYPAIRNNLAVCLKTLGENAEANEQYEAIVAFYDDLIRREPSNAIHHYYKASALYYQGKLDQSLAEYQATLTIDPNFVLAKKSIDGLLRKMNARSPSK
jgi:hypothetical protein